MTPADPEVTSTFRAINPVLAGPAGIVAVDAKLRLAPVGAEPDPALRRLRPAEDG